jgi:ankyrin repeat protein
VQAFILVSRTERFAVRKHTTASLSKARYSTPWFTLTDQCTTTLFTQVEEPLQDTELDCTTVHEAAAKGHIGCLQLLLARDEQIPLSINDEQQTPLHVINHSISPACCEMTAMLLASMSPAYLQTVINAGDQHGATALYSTACPFNTWQSQVLLCNVCARALMAAGAKADVFNKEGKAALTVNTVIYDVEARALEHAGDAPFDSTEWRLTLQALQTQGVDINASACLHMCVDSYNGAFAAAKLLLACGADPMVCDSQGYTLLHAVAAKAGSCASFNGYNGMQLLHDHYSDDTAAEQELLTAATPLDQTTVHLAACCPRNLRQLIELGAGVNERDYQGHTALHLACMANMVKTEPVQLLLDASADVSVYSSTRNSKPSERCWHSVHYAAVHLSTLLLMPAHY